MKEFVFLIKFKHKYLKKIIYDQYLESYCEILKEEVNKHQNYEEGYWAIQSIIWNLWFIPWLFGKRMNDSNYLQ